MRSRARSLPTSIASSLASRGSVSPASRTRIFDASATTWALVTISPSDVVMIPVPIDFRCVVAGADVGADRDDGRSDGLRHRRHVDPRKVAAAGRDVDRLAGWNRRRRRCAVDELLADQHADGTGRERDHRHRRPLSRSASCQPVAIGRDDRRGRWIRDRGGGGGSGGCTTGGSTQRCPIDGRCRARRFEEGSPSTARARSLRSVLAKVGSSALCRSRGLHSCFTPTLQRRHRVARHFAFVGSRSRCVTRPVGRIC